MIESSIRTVVTGLIAQYPLPGVTWDYLQYPLGLKRLGHDVYYLEDTGRWPYNPVRGGVGADCAYNVEYLAGIMSRFGLGDRWAYRFPGGTLQGGGAVPPQWFGLDDARREAILGSADLLINVSCTLARPEEYRAVRRLAYIDSDPVFTQVKLARGQADFRKLVDAHDLHFSFGESLSNAVPKTGHCWRPTRQPIVLSQWRPSPPRRRAFTTVMNWTSYNLVNHDGQTYGQKDIEFRRFVDLPGMVAPSVLEVAVNDASKNGRTPVGLLAHKGWRVVNPGEVCPDVDSYRDYIESSLAEWSVAKNGYVLGQPGWFSCRSACYLAAAKPVVVQDTGVAGVLPVGEGILPFRTLDEAAAAVREVERNYEQHSRAARAIAEEYFDSDKVLAQLIEESLSPSERLLEEVRA